MKISVLSGIVPYPLNEGGKTAQFYFLKQMCNQHEVLFLTEDTEANKAAGTGLLKELPALKLFYLPGSDHSVKLTVPERVLMKLLWLLRRKKKKQLKDTDLTNNDFFVYPVKPYCAGYIDNLHAILNKEHPDILQVDFIGSASIGLLNLPNIKKILVMHDLRFVSVMQSAHRLNKSEIFKNYLTDYVQTIEKNFMNNFDGIVVFSNTDKEKLNNIGLNKVHACPFAVVDTLFAKINTGYQIKKIIFIGPEHHLPNADAAQWLIKEISELANNQFGITTEIIGEWTPETVAAYGDNPAVKFTGFAPDLKVVVQNALMVVPLRIGSGIRTKIIEAFAMGIPVISTSVGMEGIGVRNEIEFLEANTTKEFLKAIETVLSESFDLQGMRMNAQHLVQRDFSEANVYKKRMEIYGEVLAMS